MPVVTPMTRTPSAAPASASAPARKDLVSIAVLPFVNRSASVDDEYFSDGLADELLSVLAKINGLRVIARSSAFVFKGKQVPVAEIGKALDVATLLEGSVRKAANRIRVSVQLVSVVDNSHLWSETYDRTLEDIFAVQDDIAQSVVKELRTTLLGNDADADASGAAKAEVAQAAKGRATDPEAHRIYLQARHLLDRLTRENSMKGIAYLLESLELNPDFALAWTELGKAYSYEAQFGWVPPAEGFRRARQAVERGLLLEPDLAEGHAVKGWIQLHGLEFSGAEWSLRRALELAPGSALVLRWAGSIAAHLGRFEEAIEFYRRSIDRDPLSSAAYHNLGITLFSTHQLEEAAKAYRKALELSPERIVTHALLAELLSFQGRHVEALEEVMREPHESRRLSTLAVIHHAAGRYEDSEKALHEVKDKYASVSAYEIAGAHALRNEPDQAFEWLERAYTQSDPILWEIKSDSWFQFLHDDLRWSAFLKKIGLAD
jgi:TolB-like protein/Tfp pilus assembly protein PilF